MTNTVRAKFRVTGVHHHETHSPNDTCATVSLVPDFGGVGKDNIDWSKYTPQGKLEMMITNPTAIDFFDLGKKYYLEFSREEDVLAERNQPKE